MHAMIMAEVALLKYTVFIIAIFWNINMELIYLDINISVCIGIYSLLTDLMLKPGHYPHPSAECTERRGAKNLQYFCTITIIV